MIDVERKQFLADKESLYRDAESRTNRDNAAYLFVLAMILILSDLLNEIGVFEVVPLVMRIGALCGTICFLTPVLALIRPLHLLGRKPEQLRYRAHYKYVILAFAWLGTAMACITLTHHTVILMAVPIMMMAQYRDTKQLLPIAIVLATACVLVGVYGGYFFGCFDGNLLQLKITDENVADLALRASIATPERMLDLLLHYALPRELIVLALILLTAKISRRSDEMLQRQSQLQSVAEREMQRTNEIQWQIINGMANLIENRDSSTGEHVKRTSFYVKSIVEKLRMDPAYCDALSEEAAETIVEAAPLHDIGKIVVPDRILQKPERLTRGEYEEIKRHASEGVKVIENVLGNVENEAFLRYAIEIAGSHHERWDGNGYPDGRIGESIPLSARIMSVADVFDALVSKRVYKLPMSPEEAFQIIEDEAGKQFDPAIARAFCSLRTEILGFLREHADAPANTETPGSSPEQGGRDSERRIPQIASGRKEPQIHDRYRNCG